MGDVEERFTQVLQLMQSLKVDSADEISKLRKENGQLKQQIESLCKRPETEKTRSSMTFSNLAMMDVVRMAKDSNTLEESMGIIEEDFDDFDIDSTAGDDSKSDGLGLTDSLAIDPTKSSYATGYKYDLLKGSEVLITMHDVGEANRDIDSGPGMWVNYILTKERNSTLKISNKAKLLKEGKYYHLKSLKEGLPIEELVAYCKSRGIRAIVPSSVSDEIYCARNMKKLQSNDIWPLCCEDPQSYITLDHKWLSYLFCKENGIAQSESLPLRVDTADACRALAEKTIRDGKPVFLKECFDTCAGDGVIKVDKMEDYFSAVVRISKGKGPQRADTGGLDQHIIIQAGHPGRIACCHSIFYKGEMVSTYVTKENGELMDKLGDLKAEMTFGTWSPNKVDMTCSFKLDLDDPSDRNVRDQAVSIMEKVGKDLNYSGMLETEFIIANEPDAILHVLEFNPRFSGACHAYVGAGMVQDYMHILGLIASTKDDTDAVMEVAGTTRVRSDTHVPKSNFKDYNAGKFYMKQPLTIVKLRYLH
ncbi:hypothetical protein FRACYDRAFT_234930 [Fragilariopsis cylindrus CCMP1102]|uniref:ATP-grasp domain-containing protein n=1 Tax=Fragilariopsis cylindrus CCMP1102 TaxID=635003 RepID=A0A1E7FTY3_9STRA|nr:hypothetical protein FRACYDRAFT_234930 [Fragilariopsis cylindrus CCMP1102]|eukprot:OEU21303.1 hypothetical protein FRACYDRAFT_234930 [Fragilariopsis cylindrus CCMP1102]